MRTFKREDIINNGVINEKNLDAFCQQIEDNGCYDKVGTEFYNISTNMAFSKKIRDKDTINAWLDHIETLPVTSKNIGYEISKKEEKFINNSSQDILVKELEMFRSIDWIALGKYFDRDIGLDLPSWEFMSKAIDDEDVSGVLKYLQMCFNTDHNYNNLIEGDVKNKHQQILDILSSSIFYQKELESAKRKHSVYFEEQYFLTCLAEECGEIMELMFLDSDNSTKIELELNDIIAVATILDERNIIPLMMPVLQDGPKSNSTKEIYSVLKDILHVTHKSLRFGLLDLEPQTSIKNITKLQRLIPELINLIHFHCDYELWENHTAKKDKVLEYYDYAKISNQIN